MLPPMPRGRDGDRRARHRLAILVALLASLVAGAAQGWSVSGSTTWPSERALPRFPAPRHLDIVDLDPARCSCGGDDALMLASLEGVVNRDMPSIYLLEPTGGTPGESSGAWLGDLGVPSTPVSEWDLIARHRHRLSGIVEYDPAVPDTINVATAMAGLRDAVVASPALARRLEHLGLPLLADLADQHFTGGHDAYLWALTHVWPQTTHRMLVAQAPGPAGMLRDYAVANRAMVVWLDPTVPDDARLLDRYLDGLAPNSPYVGWFPGDVDGEHHGVLQLSRHAVYTVAADRFTNLTVFSGVTAPSSPPPPAPAVKLQNRIYVTITASDGDNLQFDEHRLRVLWDDPARGRVPINWTLQPLLVDAAPTILHHYQSTATVRDMLLAGPSGAGYMYPDSWPDRELGAFTRQSGRYMRAAGMRSLVLDNSPAGQLQYAGNVASSFAADVSPQGVIVDQSDTGLTGVVDDTAVVSGPVTCAADLPGHLAAMSQGWDGSSPRFISLSAIAWCSTPGEIVDLVRSLDSRYQVVRGDQLFDLVRRAHDEGG
jgi:GxGYxYP putative glycoside hydrolase C-terminal domain/GxGYxYP third domain/GxGYxYP_N second domain